ncbi:MAG: efflux RND transporter periplasmic adaptor subunit [Chitinophagaceae bacterium]
MKKITNTTLIITIALLSACGGKNTLESKKAELEKLKSGLATTNESIKKLEAEIAKLDTSKKEDIAKLIGVTPVVAADFKHYIQIQGRVDADNISYVSPRLGGGQVKAIYITKGQSVRKGQLLLKLDDAIIKQSIAAAKQSLETLKTQLALAKDLYNRQTNLWKQGIGTEVQVISAKTQVETLEKQLKAGEENIKTAQEQASASNITSDVDGVVDELNVKVGEFFSGYAGTVPQIKIVNTSSLKIVTEVPENYAGKVKAGSKVVIILSDINKTYNSSITFLGKTINANNRSFIAEAKLPYDGLLRPNQNAEIKIEDYSAANAIAVSVNTVQTDDKGKYVYVAVQEGNKLVARKKAITVGELNGNLIEIKSGLTAGEKLITEGFQNVYDGQSLKLN